MGHSQLATTSRYLHARPASERAAVFTSAFSQTLMHDQSTEASNRGGLIAGRRPADRGGLRRVARGPCAAIRRRWPAGRHHARAPPLAAPARRQDRAHPTAATRQRRRSATRRRARRSIVAAPSLRDAPGPALPGRRTPQVVFLSKREESRGDLAARRSDLTATTSGSNVELPDFGRSAVPAARCCADAPRSGG